MSLWTPRSEFHIRCLFVWRVPGLVTNSFCLINFVTKQIPLWGEYCSLLVLPPINSLVSVTYPFELTQRPSWPSALSRALLPEIQRNKDPIRFVVQGTEVPGLRQKQVTQTLMMCLIKQLHFLTLIHDCKRPNVVKLVTKPREVLGVFDWSDHSLDCEEGCQVGRVRGDNNEGEEPPDTPHDTRGSSFGVQTGTLERKTRSPVNLCFHSLDW